MTIDSYQYRNIFRKNILNYIGKDEVWAFHPMSINYLISSHGRVKNIIKNSLIKSFKNKKGYLQLRISFEDGPKTVRVHRLVCETFFDYLIDSSIYQVNHIDCNKENNNISNLEWTTNQENLNHAVKNNLMKKSKGNNHYYCKFKDTDILEMRELKNLGFTVEEISKAYNGGSIYISTLIRGTSDRKVKENENS